MTDDLHHIGKTTAIPLDRFRYPEITSKTKHFNGAARYGKASETTVINLERDRILREYVERVTSEILTRCVDRDIKTTEELTIFVSLRIAQDFRYSTRMASGGPNNYHARTYPPRSEVPLGKIMQNQDMICRHMALLAAVILEHLHHSPGTISLPTNALIDFRYMADSEIDNADPGNRNSHGYVIMKNYERFENGGAGFDYFIIDPAGRIHGSLRKIMAQRENPKLERYIFSIARVAMQDEDETANGEFIHWLKNKAQDIPWVMRAIRDAERNDKRTILPPGTGDTRTIRAKIRHLSSNIGSLIRTIRDR